MTCAFMFNLWQFMFKGKMSPLVKILLLNKNKKIAFFLFLSSLIRIFAASP